MKVISSCSIIANAIALVFLLKFSVKGEQKTTDTAPLGGSCHGLDLPNVIQGPFRCPSISGCHEFAITLNGLFEAAVLIN